MNILWEVMVTEMRAERLELDNRRHFTPEKKPIELTRVLLADWTTISEPEDIEIVTSRSATNLRMAEQDNLFEVG